MIYHGKYVDLGESMVAYLSPCSNNMKNLSKNSSQNILE
jgi:hypothetical protein